MLQSNSKPRKRTRKSINCKLIHRYFRAITIQSNARLLIPFPVLEQSDEYSYNLPSSNLYPSIYPVSTYWPIRRDEKSLLLRPAPPLVFRITSPLTFSRTWGQQWPLLWYSTHFSITAELFQSANKYALMLSTDDSSSAPVSLLPNQNLWTSILSSTHFNCAFVSATYSNSFHQGNQRTPSSQIQSSMFYPHFAHFLSHTW